MDHERLTGYMSALDMKRCEAKANANANSKQTICYWEGVASLGFKRPAMGP